VADPVAATGMCIVVGWGVERRWVTSVQRTYRWKQARSMGQTPLARAEFPTAAARPMWGGTPREISTPYWHVAMWLGLSHLLC
jgi:hypothetical protein